MRFVAEGPSIPDRLLEVRDEGRVVFLCGAGVSIPAGMLDFVSLTRGVLDHLQAPDDLPARQAFAAWTDDTTPVSSRIPLDQIFNSLRDEYSRDQINRIVAELLTTPSSAPTPQEHSIIARLSANKKGIPQIVTTNFDHLFEQTGVTKDLNIFEPPTFPDLRVESRRGAVAWALWASLRFLSPLIKRDVRISRIRLPDRLHLKAHGGGPRWTRLCRITPSSPNTTLSGKPGATRQHLMAPDQEMTYSLVQSSSLIPDNQFGSPAPPSP